MVKRPPFVGVGTGRCGTNSLVHILNSCKNVRATHEEYDVNWYEPPKDLQRFVMEATESQGKGVLRGDVAYYLLPHLGFLKSQFPDLKIVALRRPKEEVVNSFMAWITGKGRTRMADKSFKYSLRFPAIEAANVRQSWEFYWEYYNQVLDYLKDDSFTIWTKELNEDKKLHELCDYLEIPEEDRNFPEGEERKQNSFSRVVQRQLGAFSS